MSFKYQKEGKIINNFLLILFPRNYYSKFRNELARIETEILDPKNPIEDLNNKIEKLVNEYRIIFWLNSRSFYYEKKQKTYALFEEQWGKKTRHVYRIKLKEVRVDVGQNKNQLTAEELLKILIDLEQAYNRLSGKNNAFHRYPCKSGKIKIQEKLEEINGMVIKIKETSD